MHAEAGKLLWDARQAVQWAGARRSCCSGTPAPCITQLTKAADQGWRQSPPSNPPRPAARQYVFTRWLMAASSSSQEPT